MRYLNRLNSAASARQRPTAALLELDDPYSDWTSHDYRLQEALTTLERDKCKTCGNPAWLCHTAHSGVEVELRIGACYVDAEVKDFEKNNPNAIPLESGEYRYGKIVGIKNEDGTYEPLPSRAEAYAVLADKES